MKEKRKKDNDEIDNATPNGATNQIVTSNLEDAVMKNIDRKIRQNGTIKMQYTEPKIGGKKSIKKINGETKGKRYTEMESKIEKNKISGYLEMPARTNRNSNK